MKDPNQTLRARVLTSCRTGFIVGAINLDELFPEKYFYIECDNRHSCSRRFTYKMQLFMSLNTKYQWYNLEEQIRLPWTDHVLSRIFKTVRDIVR